MRSPVVHQDLKASASNADWPPTPPSPPQPPVQHENDALVRKFPFASCGARKADVSPYWMTPPVGPINATSSNETYCWQVRADGAVAGGSRCATMTIYKLEFIVERACVERFPRPLRAATINGVTVFPTYGRKTWKGTEYGMLSFSQLTEDFPMTPAGGLRLCLTLDTSSGSCATPAELCYGDTCVYSLYDPGFTCCPVSQVPYT
ncbi:hypothetical protein PLESTB_000847800 [Pleodorina starrii]|uniref:Pherophorin domain-containing protein n=1 Tax=Pleodorina starrii TaxID=330485 RepID=A0A9W6BM55_9CHLO|nr:hypothetical protein PLESTM_002092900 [Pleodorina starrii]GLC54295.1 hypothetical protein PLESTB_000847800 [Pleodorina starrii]